MSNTAVQLHLAAAGSIEFCRRIGAACRQWSTEHEFGGLSISTAPLPEARALILTEKPHALLLELNSRAALHDVQWMRNLLKQTRDRFGRNIHIILAVAGPEKFLAASSLFFEDERSLNPSGFFNDIIIAPPLGVVGAPTMIEQLRDCLSHLVEALSVRGSSSFPLPALWEDSWVPVMCDPQSREVWTRWLPRYARYINENPIIIGPSGSGKTRLAAALHRLSGRSGPFVSITPRDFSSTELVQAELFGAVAGAYTGAVDKWGLVRRADKGTLFIDELQSIDRDLQGKLITFIENKSYRRVGEAEVHQADVRFVFATNRTLQDLVREQSLRDDFAYRLERLQINLSALEDRRLDIAAGMLFCLGKVLREREVSRAHEPVQGLTQDAYRILYLASWPGNLRQLENSVARLIEVADIRGLRLIDAQSAENSIAGLLGKSPLSSEDIFERAAGRLVRAVRSGAVREKSALLGMLEEEVRSEALSAASGSPEEAAVLIGDCPAALRLFASARTKV